MLRAFVNAFKIPDLRAKILFTLLIIAVYRMGSFLPIPNIDVQELAGQANAAQGGFLSFINLFSGGALSRLAVFALGIMPYIPSSIIMQLLVVVIPKLEQWQKQGEVGQKKITQYTRYMTVALALLQSTGLIFLFNTQLPGVIREFTPTRVGFMVLTLTAGTSMIMWFGELITQRGIGNGMSLIIFTSVISELPTQGYSVFRQAGVVPIIFASSVLYFPTLLGSVIQWQPFQSFLNNHLVNQASPVYIVIYGLLVVFFAYFYTAISFNPVDTADNIRKYGGFIPGIRPGKPTADHLDHILSRITLPGSLFLATIALIPSIALIVMGIDPNVFPFGGTSVLIVVGVALETMKQIESQLTMRHYEGFLR